MRGGHNRKPTALKVLSGTQKPERENKREPKPAVVQVPPPPAHLSAVERAVWVELAAQVEHLNVYTPSDYTTFRLAVKGVAMIDEEVEAMPATAKVRLLQSASAMLQRFGLDPASRARVMTAGSGAAATDELDEFAPGGARAG